MSTDPSADAGHGIWLACNAIGLFKLALCNELDIASGIGVRGTGHHAGKVGVQPIPVNLFIDKALQHAGLSHWGMGNTGGERNRSEEHTSELQSLRHLVCR